MALLEASLFAVDGRLDEARASLQDAVRRCTECDMRLYAASARVRLDELEGHTRYDFSAFEAEGVTAPSRMVDMHAPPVRGW